MMLRFLRAVREHITRDYAAMYGLDLFNLIYRFVLVRVPLFRVGDFYMDNANRSQL